MYDTWVHSDGRDGGVPFGKFSGEEDIGELRVAVSSHCRLCVEFGLVKKDVRIAAEDAGF